MPRAPLPRTWRLMPWQTKPKILSKEKILELSKNYFGKARNCQRIARNRVEKGLQHSYKNRKLTTRFHRKQWIMKINNALQGSYGIKYSRFIKALKLQNIELNRKILSDLVHHEPITFEILVNYLKEKEPELLKSKNQPNYGYIQSAVITQEVNKFEYPIRPRGTPNPSKHAEENKFISIKPNYKDRKWYNHKHVEEYNTPVPITTINFNLPYIEPYIQKKSTHPDFYTRKQKKFAAKYPTKTKEEEASYIAQLLMN